MENIKLPKENIPKIVEVRELEIETKLESPVVEKVEEVKVGGQSQSSEQDKEIEEGLKKIVGGVSSATGISKPLKIVGKVERGLGEITDSEAVKKVGEAHDQGADKTDIGGIEEGIKQIREN